MPPLCRKSYEFGTFTAKACHQKSRGPPLQLGGPISKAATSLPSYVID